MKRELIRSESIRLIVAILFVSSIGMLVTCTQSDEPNYDDAFICEDWEDTPPHEDWPCKDLRDGSEQDCTPDPGDRCCSEWHGWDPCCYGNINGNSQIVSCPGSRSGKCLKIHKGRYANGVTDIIHEIDDSPKRIYIRFYIYLPSEPYSERFEHMYEEFWRHCHFLFCCSASAAVVCLDFGGRTEEWLGSGNGENGSGYRWKDHMMLKVVSYGCNTPSTQEGVVENIYGEVPDYAGGDLPFCFEEHEDEWVYIEWMVDVENGKTSLWIAGEGEEPVKWLDEYDISGCNGWM